jgi:hypothetical protein
MKICIKCKLQKENNEFWEYKNRKGEKRLRNTCKECMSKKRVIVQDKKFVIKEDKQAFSEDQIEILKKMIDMYSGGGERPKKVNRMKKTYNIDKIYIQKIEILSQIKNLSQSDILEIVLQKYFVIEKNVK